MTVSKTLTIFHTGEEGYDDEEDLEEGTFEDYEFGTDELPSNSKVFKKPILGSPAKNDTARKDKENIENSTKPELSATEKNFESSSNSSKGYKDTSQKRDTEAESSSIRNSTEKSPTSQGVNEAATASNIAEKYDKYSIKNKVSSHAPQSCKLFGFDVV